ncbi:hypothetical protein ASPBRDRAFT_35422 [Aspergillus brasiliensis CBS 101740]|uniref:Amidohydrolase-related domain-containing protein n=1 Tax=Aspergillus brasiliensis (strain CBS 101740 / IMI 381727 / IBT 21946) TaxID=767769 RepID=A0A1L9U2W3_ASPBC|nr:hypothetical protein ASPBRDRAFT_35422 [Aspergillus brasiliensis CBS 101740]
MANVIYCPQNAGNPHYQRPDLRRRLSHLRLRTRFDRVWNNPADIRTPMPTAPECTIVDGSNSTLILGLIDAHVHVYQDLTFIETAIHYGVTTVLDMHNESQYLKKMKGIADQRNQCSTMTRLEEESEQGQ